MELIPGLNVWHYLETIAEENPSTQEDIAELFDSGDEVRANELLHEVWSWFEN